eukprot:scaffold162841_cov23-Tisochrysis_lutea.AAC.1
MRGVVTATFKGDGVPLEGLRAAVRRMPSISSIVTHRQLGNFAQVMIENRNVEIAYVRRVKAFKEGVSLKVAVDASFVHFVYVGEDL